MLALAEAKKTGKNIFIDFTGYTCTSCRAMESSMFSRADVKELFHDFVLARLYTDNNSPLNDDPYSAPRPSVADFSSSTKSCRV